MAHGLVEIGMHSVTFGAFYGLAFSYQFLHHHPFKTIRRISIEAIDEAVYGFLIHTVVYSGLVLPRGF